MSTIQDDCWLVAVQHFLRQPFELESEQRFQTIDEEYWDDIERDNTLSEQDLKDVAAQEALGALLVDQYILSLIETSIVCISQMQALYTPITLTHIMDVMHDTYGSQCMHTIWNTQKEEH